MPQPVPGTTVRYRVLTLFLGGAGHVGCLATDPDADRPPGVAARNAALSEATGPVALYEYKRIIDEGAATETILETGSIAALPTSVLEEVSGIGEPGSPAVKHMLAVWSRQSEEEGVLERGHTVWEYPVTVMSMEEHVAAMEALRPDLGDALIDQALALLVGEGAPPPEPVVDAQSEATLAAWPDAPVPLRACGARLPEYRLPQERLFMELAYGWDRDTTTAALLPLRAERATLAAAAQARLVEEVEARGGVLVGRSSRDACISVSMDREAAYDLAAAPGVRMIAVQDPFAETSGESEGESGRDGMQIKQFWDEDLIGNTPSTRNQFGRITAAIVDAGFQDLHRALKDSSTDAGLIRVKGRWDCTSAECDSCSTPNPTCTVTGNLPWVSRSDGASFDHGTLNFGVLVGDLTDGQDPTIASVLRQQYSGYAGEAGVVLLQANGQCEFECGVDRAAMLDVDVLSLSKASGTTQTCAGDWNPCVCPGPGSCAGSYKALSDAFQCRGAETVGVNLEVNNAFKDGVFVVKAAGNRGVASCTGCTVTAPGDAAGSFTVGGTMTACSNDHNDVRQAPIMDTCSTGGVGSSIGGGATGWAGQSVARTIVDVVAPGQRLRLPNCATGCCQTCTGCSGGGCTGAYSQYNESCAGGTSWAAPAVAAAAVDFKDEWITDGHTVGLLDDPGYFRTVMLLMGDRWDGDSYLTLGYDRRWGGGRLKMRKWNSAGMDGPWGDYLGKVTLGQSEVYTHTIGWLADDVDALKAVAWWYEPMTDSAGAQTAWITMRLRSYVDAGCSEVYGTSTDSSYDTKKMIFRGNKQGDPGDPGGKCRKLVLEGSNVTANDEDAGQHRRVVYFAYFYEDTDRDDAGGPYLECWDPPTCSSLKPDDVERP